MGYNVKISDNGKYIIGEVDEPLTREIALQLAKEYVRLIQSTGIKRILNDMRCATNIMSTIQDYFYAYTDVKSIALPADICSAIVTSAEESTHHFQETVAQNAGYTVKVFHSTESAVAWLLDD
jgi:hypothetical protein